MRLLDEGTLYVAKFTGDSPASEIDGSGKLPADGEFDGVGEWIPLATGMTSHVPGMTAEEVYVFTRLAADKVGATKMDRPEDVEPHPHTGRVYVALTNNKDRGAAGKAGPDEANPRTGNKHGHILELEERRSDAAAKSFRWKLLLVCGDPDDPPRTSLASRRARSARSPARTTSPSTSTATCGLPPTATPSAPTTAFSPSRSRAPTAATSSGSDRAQGRRSLRPGHHPRPDPHRPSAPWRDRRRHSREPRLRLARRPRQPAAPSVVAVWSSKHQH